MKSGDQWIDSGQWSVIGYCLPLTDLGSYYETI
mgnify:CR=1 FL=1